MEKIMPNIKITPKVWKRSTDLYPSKYKGLLSGSLYILAVTFALYLGFMELLK